MNLHVGSKGSRPALDGIRAVASHLQIDPRTVASAIRNGGAAMIAAALEDHQPVTRDWYTIRNAGEKTEVFLYDEIGVWGTPASQFIEEVRAVKGPLDVRISSVGGDVFDGIAIYNALRSHPAPTTTIVDGAALSIASVIAQAGDHRVMMSGSQMMIHQAWGLTVGNAADHRKMIDVLEKQDGIIAGIYAERAGGAGAKAHFSKLMAAETWLDADEAVSERLADAVVKHERAEPKEEADEPVAAKLVAEFRAALSHDPLEELLV